MKSVLLLKAFSLLVQCMVELMKGGTGEATTASHLIEDLIDALTGWYLAPSPGR